MVGFWRPDREALTCAGCNIPFTWINRRHHCRRCGEIVCQACSGHRVDLKVQDVIRSNQRICIACYFPMRTKIHSLALLGLKNEMIIMASMIEHAETWRVCRDGVKVECQPGIRSPRDVKEEKNGKDNKMIPVTLSKDTLLFVLDQRQDAKEHWLFHSAVEKFEAGGRKIDMPVQGWSTAKIGDVIYCERVSPGITREFWTRLWRALIFSRVVTVTDALTVGRLVSPQTFPDVTSAALEMVKRTYDRFTSKAT
jgi:hypothetical protein